MSQVFLSHSPKDEREAAAIYEALCRLGLSVWWAGALPSRAESFVEIGHALQRCDTMVVVVSPRLMASDLVISELQYAATHLSYCYRIFPVMIEPTAKLPWLFSIMKVFDLTKNRARGLKNLAKAIQAGENRTAPQIQPGAARNTRR